MTDIHEFPADTESTTPETREFAPQQHDHGKSDAEKEAATVNLAALVLADSKELIARIRSGTTYKSRIKLPLPVIWASLKNSHEPKNVPGKYARTLRHVTAVPQSVLLTAMGLEDVKAHVVSALEKGNGSLPKDPVLCKNLLEGYAKIGRVFAQTGAHPPSVAVALQDYLDKKMEEKQCERDAAAADLKTETDALQEEIEQSVQLAGRPAENGSVLDNVWAAPGALSLHEEIIASAEDTVAAMREHVTERALQTSQSFGKTESAIRESYENQIRMGGEIRELRGSVNKLTSWVIVAGGLVVIFSAIVAFINLIG